MLNKEEAYEKLDEINNKLASLDLYPPLGWAYCFDVLKDIFDTHQYADAAETDLEAIKEGLTFRDIFNQFFDDIDSLSIELDLGLATVQETIYDWMRDKDILVSTDAEEDHE